jgi:hypothetical protein
VPKFVAPADPAAQWTGALRNAAFFACADNYLIDVKFGIIMDVEASRAIRQAEVGASRTMIDRTEATFGIKPDWLVADTAYGSAPNLHFLVDQKGIEPHVPVIDKSRREDGTFIPSSARFDLRSRLASPVFHFTGAQPPRQPCARDTAEPTGWLALPRGRWFGSSVSAETTSTTTTGTIVMSAPPARSCRGRAEGTRLAATT